MKAKILIFLLSLATLTMAQTISDTRIVQDIVASVSNNVELSASQSEQLILSATRYLEAIKSANTQYADAPDALVKEKANAWQEYMMQLRSILTDSQYLKLQQQQQQHKQSIMNQIKGGTKQ